MIYCRSGTGGCISKWQGFSILGQSKILTAVEKENRRASDFRLNPQHSLAIESFSSPAEELTMCYRLRVAENSVLGEDKYVNAKGITECVEFVRQAAGAPATSEWEQGLKVSDAKPGEILRGTVIATFDKNGKYPTDHLGKHAAIYLSHTKKIISVLDQWADQGEVLPRPIRFARPSGTKRSNDADTFYVVL